MLEGERQVVVNSLDDVRQLLVKGDRQKRRAATAMNERSSRAHSLFILTLTQTQTQTQSQSQSQSRTSPVESAPPPSITVKSRFFLADLGGSEQVKRSKVNAGQTSERGTGFEMGAHMREAVYINMGLLALKKCIEALNNSKQNGQVQQTAEQNEPYIPYQDSKLTMLLSSGLGGCSKTSVVVCGSTANTDAQETLQALRFAEKCSSVKNQVTIKQSVVASVLDKLDREMAELEHAIQQKEHWVTVEEVRSDTTNQELSVAAAGQSLVIKPPMELEGSGSVKSSSKPSSSSTSETKTETKTGPELSQEKQEEPQEKNEEQKQEEEKETPPAHVNKTTKLVGAEEERASLEALIRKRAALTGENIELTLNNHGFGVFRKVAKGTNGEDDAAFRYGEFSKKGLLVKGKMVAHWKD